MKTYDVVVEKALYCKGMVKMKAESEQEAKDKVMKDIRSGQITTYTVAWGEPKYHDGSFQTTGDSEESKKNKKITFQYGS